VNVASGGICIQKLIKSTGFTSHTDSAMTSANSVTSACAWVYCSSVRWSPYQTAFTIASTLAGTNGPNSINLVNISFGNITTERSGTSPMSIGCSTSSTSSIKCGLLLLVRLAVMTG